MSCPACARLSGGAPGALREERRAGERALTACAGARRPWSDPRAAALRHSQRLPPPEMQPPIEKNRRCVSAQPPHPHLSLPCPRVPPHPLAARARPRACCVLPLLPLSTYSLLLPASPPFRFSYPCRPLPRPTALNARACPVPFRPASLLRRAACAPATAALPIGGATSPAKPQRLFCATPTSNFGRAMHASVPASSQTVPQTVRNQLYTHCHTRAGARNREGRQQAARSHGEGEAWRSARLPGGERAAAGAEKQSALGGGET